MPLVVKKSQGNFTLMPEGTQQVVIASVENLGKVNTAFGPKLKARVRFAASDGSTVIRDYTQSLHEKSRLYRDIKSITGKAPTDDFDVETLIGRQIQVVIQHETGTNGKTYANIAAIMQPVRGQNVRYNASASTAAKAEELTITDEDIPF